MRYRKKQLLIIIAIVLLVLPAATAKAQPVKGTYLYNLSNFTGTISFSWPRIFVDQERNEVYVVYQNIIRVFNATGMEVYSFGDDLDLGTIVDLTLDQDGNILLLSYKWSETIDTGYEITRCNYRGEPKSIIAVKNLPPQYSKFLPNRMVYREGNLYLASLVTMVVVVTDSDGVFKEVYDILPMLELEEKEKQDAMMDAFSIDKDGDFLFTIPPLFRAYKITPDRKVSYFGKSGSTPGKFNIVAGIASDSKGNIFVVDKEDRVYVTQAGNKGISVFKVTYN